MSKLQNKRIRIPSWAKSDVFLGIATLILWLVSAAFSLYVTLELQQTILRLVIEYYTENRFVFHAIRQWSTLLMVGFWLAFVIITGEFHYQNLRKARSWKVFKWSYFSLIVVLLIALIF